MTGRNETADGVRNLQFGVIDNLTSGWTNETPSDTTMEDLTMGSTTESAVLLSTLTPVTNTTLITTASSSRSFASTSTLASILTGKVPELEIDFMSTTEVEPTSVFGNTDGGDLFFGEEKCWPALTESYDVTKTAICAILLIFGVVYILYGYRLFKSVMFLVGFVFGAIIVYCICLEESLLPTLGNVLVSVTAGFLFGLITMLVGYVGLFILGLHTGLFIGTGCLLAIHVSSHIDFIPPPDTVWITITTLMFCGLVGACSALYFQKGCTILGTSLYGAVLVIMSLDYFIENFNLLLWFWDKLKDPTLIPMSSTLFAIQSQQQRNLCLVSWVLIILWPLIIMFGLFCQWFATGKGTRHHDDIRPSSSRRNGQLDLQRIRQQESKAEHRQRKYRYLYQVRTAHGDVISQNCIQNLQKKVSPPLDQDSLRTYNSDLSRLTIANPSESRTTTMSHLP